MRDIIDRTGDRRTTRLMGGVDSVCLDGYITCINLSSDAIGTRNQRKKNWFGSVALWLSVMSMLAYFFFSDVVKNEVVFLRINLGKALAILSGFLS
jgi:hypothetical protein